MSYNQEIYDRVVQHLADTRLYEAETQGNASNAIHRHRLRLADLLARDLRSDLHPEVNRAMTEVNSIAEQAVTEYGSAAITFNVNNLNKTVGGFFTTRKPTGVDVLQEIVGSNIGVSKTMAEQFNSIGSHELIRLQQIIGRGILEKKSTAEIIETAIKSTALTENQVKALVRTSLTRTQSVAMDKVMEANSDVIQGYRYTAVLDAKTSAICSGLDGRVFPLTEKRYRPPMHWNCRSSLVPVLKSKADLVKTNSSRINPTALEAVNAKKLMGDVPAVETYGGWLKRQPMDVKLQHLGSEERVSLFEGGTLAVKEFFTNTGSQISLATLRRLDNIRTSVFPNRQTAIARAAEEDFAVRASRPYDVLRSPEIQNQLKAMYISDASSMNQSMSLVDFRGTSLIGKRTSRSRSNNEFDERNTSWDPFTGEVKSTLLYDPDFSVYQERRDFLMASKLLTKDQKEFIATFADSLEDSISVNQQSAVLENMRVVFERYAKDKTPWEDLMNVLRAESQYSVVNVSRILDRRSRERADLFSKYLSGEEPKVQIFGDYHTFDTLSEKQLDNQRYIENWKTAVGREKARAAYYSKETPLRQFIFDPAKKKVDWKKKLKKAIEAEIPAVKLINNWGKPTESMLQKASRNLRESYRNIVDLEFLFQKSKANSLASDFSEMFFGTTKGKDFTEALLSTTLNDAKAIDVFADVMAMVADGKATDYDSLAINIGKSINQKWPIDFPLRAVTLADHHKAGSRILEALRDQKKIRVVSRGVVRRSAIDIDTGRPSGAWQDTVSREVSVLDPDMLELQKRNRQNIIAQRLGVVQDRDRLYVRPGEKTYFDARGKNTGKSIITRRASGNYDKLIVDRDFADMLNHTMSVEYETDNVFASFMDDVVRFRDPRGQVQKYDDLNDFRKLILQRGDQGFGFMQTVKWHTQRGKPFKALAQIDGRGRVYYEGYLTPTGGEVVRPFLNSATARQFGQEELEELSIQLGAMIGPATEALTQAGRMEIFLRSQQEILSLGRLMQSKTQRDRRIREFLEHPLVRSHEAEGIPKISRMALEYARVYDHVGGDFSKLMNGKSTYYSKLMIENDASSSGAQIIGLSTGDRSISINSNVLATDKKNRLYDLVAMDTASDPEFHAIKALSGANIQWDDLAKAAKAQNMVSFYGAGKATQAANIEAKFAKVLEGKGYQVITKDTLNGALGPINKAIKDADYLGAVETSRSLKEIKKELIEVVNGEIPLGNDLIQHARDVHPDVAEFVDKLTNVKSGLIGPAQFRQVSEIMSKHLAERAPVTGKFVQFWKIASKAYINETEKVDIPWVTFDGKVLYQRYRPKIQESINFIDPVTGRRVKNIYQDSVTESSLKGKSSLIRASIGFGVNGNHMNDASIVRQFHLWGKKNNVGTATIHDAFFTNIGDATRSKWALREIYADALEGDTINNTLKRMRDEGMSEKTYRELVAKARADGLIDPPNKITRADVLAKIPKGMDWYGIGP